MRISRTVLAAIVVLAAGCEVPEKKPAAEAPRAEPAKPPVKKAEAPVKPEPAEAPAKKAEAKAIPPGQKAVLEAESMTLFDADVKDLPGAGGGKAVLLGKRSSIVDTVVTLSRGKYRIVVYAQGPDGDHDAFYLTFADGIRHRLFLSEWRKIVAAKPLTVRVEAKKPCKVVLKSAETGIFIDRVVIEPVE
jgi:hypothetical protein